MSYANIDAGVGEKLNDDIAFIYHWI